MPGCSSGLSDSTARTTAGNSVSDTETTTPIGDGTAPFRGDFQPSQSLAALVGRAATGAWKLRVEDTGTGDAGSLLSWGLYVKPQ